MSTKGTVLVTGGAGYIGSHTIVELDAAGFEVVVVDDLSNSSRAALSRVGELIGAPVTFYEADTRDRAALEKIFTAHPIDSVIHFAGLKAVGESVDKPIEYYDNNIAGTLTLLEAMRDHGCFSIIFSSSATVYGDPEQIPITEDCPKGTPTNPYGWTKWMIEQIIIDAAKADERWNAVLLRYFNPIGAHVSGRIGEDPNGIPNNLVPYIAQVAVGRRERVCIFGDDYPTPDGTGVRDYIHVVDLALGHVKALEWMGGRTGCEIFNLGTGRGYSVLDVLRAFERACGHEIPHVIESRRPGDIATCYSDPAKAESVLGWKAQFDIDRMCADSWRWQSQNPQGYGSGE
ncbi:UDP-glucose 4-epimerase GalE [Schaalia hyovaginalis]|uniref:UDP-glucose 4-epimerase n=1 Tax=Schaalia hyovaginalis TaxID=29316 RepID=A0A923E169_9ACTO|nr:UDP-glucose 4-epimerase GalE [Schaalia hyovaginalis]MBB6334063.1 UDP-glucose 4-epimerase [Schaalia hyovaginalis]MDY2667972.1 UDP-glucose 4-epimerase GalE [Schaalia hyovaginalis]